MAWGDAFTLEQVTAFELADFAQRCGVERKLLRRKARRMAMGSPQISVKRHAAHLASY